MNDLIETLKCSPHGPLFNPWFDHDKVHDADPESPDRRRSNLINYLDDRRQASTLLVGEALSYQGGTFSGIAMTSERILMDKKTGISPRWVSRKPLFPQTSNKPGGYNEPTASMVWSTMNDLDIDFYDVVIWNGCPWHPWDTKRGPLSNRLPTRDEMQAGKHCFDVLLSIFDFQRFIAVGKTAEKLLLSMELPAQTVRHPAFGGKNQFVANMKAIFQEN